MGPLILCFFLNSKDWEEAMRKRKKKKLRGTRRKAIPVIGKGKEFMLLPSIGIKGCCTETRRESRFL